MGEVTVAGSLAFAIDLVRRRNPSFDGTDVATQLRRQGWVVDDSLVQRHIGPTVPAESDDEPGEGGPEVDPYAGSLSAQRDVGPVGGDVAWRDVELADLPPPLREAVERIDGRVVPPVPVPRGRRSSATWSNHVDDMCAALRAELAAVRETAREGRIRLTAGDCLGDTERGFTARFVMETDAAVVEGASVAVDFGLDATAEAEVLQCADTSLTLWVEGKRPASIDDAVLVVDASLLLGRRLRFLQDLGASNALFDVTSATSVLSPSQQQGDVAWSSGGLLGPQQEAFVRKALAPGVTWLWGPPGTGKTTTLAFLLRELLVRGKRVLFVSNTNAAVDTALLRFLDLGRGLECGQVVRLGQPAAEALQTLTTPPVTLDGIAAARGVPAGAAIAECERSTKRVRRSNAEARLILKDPLYARDKGLIGTSESDRFDLARLVDELRIHERERDSALELGRLTDQKRALHQLVEALRTVTVNQAHVVFGTVHRTYMRDLAGERFDVVVIDEASMVSADLAAIAAGLSSGHVVVVGDFRQLGPIAVSDSEPARRWLHESAFEASGMAELVERGATPTNLVALDVQHRMRPEIARVVADGFYPEIGLRTSPSAQSRAARRPLSHLGVLTLVDTSSLRPWQGKRNGLYSRYNPVHAQVVDVLVGTAAAGRTVGAISPYAPQAQLLRALLEDPERGHAAATVHRFQGGERDLVLWDMTEGRAGATSIARWFQGTRSSDAGSRLVNVALSRARDQLVVVADLERASTLPERTSLRRTLSALRREGEVVDAREVLLANDLRTSCHVGVRDRHPLEVALDQPTTTLTLWSSAPPTWEDSRALAALDAAMRSGASVHVRVGVPAREVSWRLLTRLQRLGCHVQIVRPCWENVVITDTAVTTSSGSLLAVTDQQLWTRTQHPGFVGAISRLARRRGDSDPTSGEPDPTCAKGHPLLVDVARDQVYRHRCLRCHGDVGGGAVRTGRSRSKASAQAVPRCGSCGAEFGIDGRCDC